MVVRKEVSVVVVVKLDTHVWRYTSSSADKQGSWHYLLVAAQRGGAWSPEGSDGAVTTITTLLVLIKESLAEKELVVHIKALLDESAVHPMVVLLRGCDTTHGRRLWLAEVLRLFAERRLLQRGSPPTAHLIRASPSYPSFPLLTRPFPHHRRAFDVLV